MCEVKVTQMVCPHLHFKAVCCSSSLGDHHDSCIIDQYIDLIDCRFGSVGEFFDWIFICEIEREEDDFGFFIFKLFYGFFWLAGVSSSEDDGAWLFGEFLHCFLADACVCAGDDYHLAWEVSACSALSATCEESYSSKRKNGATGDKSSLGRE